MNARAHKEGETPGTIALCRWQPRDLAVALLLELGFWSRPIKGGDVSLGAPSDPNFGWAEKPETATKKPRNLLGFRAQLRARKVLFIYRRCYVRRALLFSFSFERVRICVQF